MKEERFRQMIEIFVSIKEGWEDYDILMEDGTYLKVTRRMGT